MPARVKVSRRGVFYDLKKSPYTYQTPYGDLLYFSSKKKLEIYTRDITEEVRRFEKVVGRYELERWYPSTMHTVKRAVYISFWRKVEPHAIEIDKRA